MLKQYRSSACDRIREVQNNKFPFNLPLTMDRFCPLHCSHPLWKALFAFFTGTASIQSKKHLFGGTKMRSKIEHGSGIPTWDAAKRDALVFVCLRWYHIFFSVKGTIPMKVMPILDTAHSVSVRLEIVYPSNLRSYFFFVRRHAWSLQAKWQRKGFLTKMDTRKYMAPSGWVY